MARQRQRSDDLPRPKTLCLWGFHTKLWELDPESAALWGTDLACRVCGRVRYPDGHWGWLTP